MPKVNTILNYFSSPRAAGNSSKLPTPAKEPPKTPSSTKKNQSKKDSTARGKSETPKPEKKEKKLKGKENCENERKRSFDDLIDEDEEEVCDSKKKDGFATPTTKKRRRIVIPEDDSTDSGDEYKPDADESMDLDDTVSSGVSEDEPDSEPDSDEETPKKKQKSEKPVRSSKNNKNNKIQSFPSKSITTTDQEQPKSKASDTESWPHLKYEFLQPNKIRDIKKRLASDPEYDPSSIYVPKDFLDQQTPAMRQWWVLKSEHFDTVLFFKVGKFYELYNMDAVVGVNELSLTFMKGDFAHSGFPEIAYGRFSASLIEKGYKVARVEQTETPDMMAERCKKMGKVTKFDKVVRREVCQVTTKGTRVYSVQDSEASSASSSYLLSIFEKSYNRSTSTYGVCFIDTSIGVFHLGQFEDDQCNSRLLTLLAHFPPAHIIYERNNLSQVTLKIINTMLPGSLKEPLHKQQFYSASKVLSILHEDEYFKDENTSEFSWPIGLQPYLNQGDSLGLTPSDDKELAITALGGCVYILQKYLVDQQLLSQGQFQTYTPPDHAIETSSQTKLAHNMVLDAMTINNLKVLGNEGSLLKILDHCCTPFGKRLIREWICRPSCRKAVIIDRQRAITELLDHPDIVQEVRAKLISLPDLDRLLSRIHALGNASKVKNHPDARAILFDYNIYSKRKVNDFITAINGYDELMSITAAFKDMESDLIKKCTRLEPEGDFPDMTEQINHFKNAFDHGEAQKQGNIIPRKGVDREYDEVILELAQIQKDLDDYLKTQKNYFGVQVKYIGSDKKRFQIEIPESQMKKADKGYELTSSRKGFKRYYTAETKELLARQIQAEEQKSKTLKDINRRIFSRFSNHYDLWSNATYNIAVLDCLISLAEYSRLYDTCIPTILDDVDDKEIILEIKEGKHPCITTENFIPNDTFINNNGTASLIIVTGPNMGGKSTLMRQVGLITIMAQIGCHVPASECKLTVADRIFTRLGASDDIMAGQSTFLVELSETATILQHATPYSLVLLDELGRGTSTYDGTAIAASVVDALTKINCRTLFSTHYHSLVEDYKSSNKVTLAHMACMVENTDEDDVSYETVTFLYKLASGACPKSYGFNAARLAGIPTEITKRAHEIATKLENEVNLRHAFSALCKITDTSKLKALINAF